jgi:hypothetical protein
MSAIDVIDVWLADPAAADLQRVVVETAWGTSDVVTHTWRGRPIGRVVDACDHRAPHGAPDEVVARVRNGRVVLAAPRDQPDAAELARAVGQLLGTQPTWIVHCEADCDQRAIAARAMSVTDVVAAIVDTAEGRIDGFIGWP